jgi:hypothetical protein
MFRAFIIIAISSVTLYRSGNHSGHPVGYLLAALQNFEDCFLSNGLNGIQDLLLFGRFGIYYHIGQFSSWTIFH